MPVQVRGRVERFLSGHAELERDVVPQAVRTAGQRHFRIERLRHEKAVKPDLARVDRLVPESTGPGPRLPAELAQQGVRRRLVFRLRGDGRKMEHRTPRADMVEVVFGLFHTFLNVSQLLVGLLDVELGNLAHGLLA